MTDTTRTIKVDDLGGTVTAEYSPSSQVWRVMDRDTVVGFIDAPNGGAITVMVAGAETIMRRAAMALEVPWRELWTMPQSGAPTETYEPSERAMLAARVVDKRARVPWQLVCEDSPEAQGRGNWTTNEEMRARAQDLRGPP